MVCIDSNSQLPRSKLARSAMSFADTTSRADEKSPSSYTCIRAKWLVDSGATCHCTFDKSLFATDSYIPLESYKKMEANIVNGEPLKTAGMGEGVKLVLKDVRHIPGLDAGVLSVLILGEQGYTSLFTARTYMLIKESLVVIHYLTVLPIALSVNNLEQTLRATISGIKMTKFLQMISCSGNWR